MFSKVHTKIIEFISQGKTKEAKLELAEIPSDSPVFTLLNYLILVQEDKLKAVDFWNKNRDKNIEEPFLSVIDGYNLYVGNDLKKLQKFVRKIKPSDVYNYVEASNLDFYTHLFPDENNRRFLDKANELKVDSELLTPEEIDGEFCLFSPVILLKIHWQVVNFLVNNFETKEDFDKFIQRLKKENPI